MNFASCIYKGEDTMNLNEFKRNYKYKSEQGEEGGSYLKWLIIGTAIIIGILAYLSK